MKYECAGCRTPLYINPATAWPERCPICHAAPLRVNTMPDPAISVTHAIGVSNPASRLPQEADTGTGASNQERKP